MKDLMKNIEDTEIASKFDRMIEWSKKHPVKAGVIGLSGVFLAQAVGFRKLGGFLIKTGVTKAAVETAKVANR